MVLKRYFIVTGKLEHAILAAFVDVFNSDLGKLNCSSVFDPTQTFNFFLFFSFWAFL